MYPSNDTKEINPRPIFVVGMNGSGTTMLIDCLGRHPELYAFPRETRLLPHILNKYANSESLKDDDVFLNAWNEVRAIPVFREINAGHLPPLPKEWQKQPRTIGNVIDTIFRFFGEKENKSRWCEKTPQHVQHIKLLASHYPEARFIHLIRDGRDCAASFHRRWKRNPYLCVYRWKKVVSEGRDQGQTIGDRYMEVKFEDLTSNPKTWMNMICIFVGVTFDSSVLTSRRPQSKEKGSMGSIEPQKTRWKEYFGNETLRKIESIAGKELGGHGYEVNHNAGDNDPSPALLLYWRAYDYVMQFTQEFFGKLTGSSKKSWLRVLQQPHIAIKQFVRNKY